jgi:hypothetical protein
MCPKCGVKMQTIQEESELVIHMCPISKDWYMTFSGSLLKRLEKISELEKISIQDLIHKAVRKGIKTLEKSE